MRIDAPPGDGYAVLSGASAAVDPDGSPPPAFSVTVGNAHGEDKATAIPLVAARLVDAGLAARHGASALCAVVPTIQQGWLALGSAGGALALRPGSHVGEGNCGATCRAPPGCSQIICQVGDGTECVEPAE